MSREDPEVANRPVPPARLRGLVGETDSVEEFLGVGRSLAGMMASLGLLEPGVRLLDVGCGCGRAALQLRTSRIAAYRGFDRNPELVAWAQENVAACDPRFEFRHVPVASPYDTYDGHTGTLCAEELVFPYPDAEFDIVLLASVFTHLPTTTTRRYLAEAARVLVPRGRLLASWYLTSGSCEHAVGLGYHHPREEQAEAVRAAGFRARALTPRPDEAEGGSLPLVHEWFLLTRESEPDRV